VDSALLTAARGILNQAYQLLWQGKAENSGDFLKFDELVANENPKYPPAATTTLADAVHALRAAESAAAALASTKALDQAICTINPPAQGVCKVSSRVTD
jgi:hypothetical protein